MSKVEKFHARPAKSFVSKPLLRQCATEFWERRPKVPERGSPFTWWRWRCCRRHRARREPSWSRSACRDDVHDRHLSRGFLLSQGVPVCTTRTALRPAANHHPVECDKDAAVRGRRLRSTRCRIAISLDRAEQRCAPFFVPIDSPDLTGHRRLQVCVSKCALQPTSQHHRHIVGRPSSRASGLECARPLGRWRGSRWVRRRALLLAVGGSRGWRGMCGALGRRRTALRRAVDFCCACSLARAGGQYPPGPSCGPRALREASDDILISSSMLCMLCYEHTL